MRLPAIRLLPAGSIAWLLAHELRLTLRGGGRSGGSSRRPSRVIVLGIVAVVLCIPGWLLASKLKQVQTAIIPQLAMGVDLVLVMLFTLMTSATVASTAIAFFERGDLDLLLSSPIPPRRVLTVRCVGIALNSALLWILLITPFAVPGLIQGDLRWFGVYPVLVGLGLLAAAVGLMLAMALFRLIGPKRTRAAATVASAFIGVSFGLVGQAQNLVGRDIWGTVWARMQVMAGHGLFDAGQPLAWPAEGLLGDLPIAFAMFGAALVVFALVTQSVGRRFGADAAAAAGSATRTRVARGALKTFASGPFRVMLGKELKLIRRDASLLSQTLIQVLYLGVIFGALLLRKSSKWGGFTDGGAAALLVFLAGNLAAVFGWIVMSTEEATELLASAPPASRVLRRAKLIAAMIPVAVIMAVPVGALAWLSPAASVSALVCCAGVAWSAGLLSIWFEKPARRSDLRRRRNGSFLSAVIGGVVGLLWSGAAFLGAMGLPWAWGAIAPALIAIVIMGAVSKPERAFAETLQAAA